MFVELVEVFFFFFPFVYSVSLYACVHVFESACVSGVPTYY